MRRIRAKIQHALRHGDGGSECASRREQRRPRHWGLRFGAADGKLEIKKLTSIFWLLCMFANNICLNVSASICIYLLVLGVLLMYIDLCCFMFVDLCRIMLICLVCSCTKRIPNKWFAPDIFASSLGLRFIFQNLKIYKSIIKVVYFYLLYFLFLNSLVFR